MKQILLSCLFLIGFLAHAQQNETDSLMQVLKTSKGEERLKQLHLLAVQYFYNAPQKAMDLSQQSLQLATKLESPKGLCRALTDIGIIYDVSGKFDSAVFYYDKSLATALNNKLEQAAGAAYCNLGLTYYNNGHYRTALDNLLKAVPCLEKENDYASLGATYLNIGIIQWTMYSQEEGKVKAKQYFLMAERYCKLGNNISSLIGCYSSLGGCFDKVSQKDSALFYYRKALDLELKNNNKYGQAKTLNNIGLVFSLNKDYAGANHYLNEVLRINKELKDENEEAKTLISIADNYREIGNLSASRKYAHQALEIAQTLKNNKLLSNTYLELSHIEQDGRNETLALNYLIQYVNYKDSLMSEEKQRALVEMTEKFETQKKETENKLLKRKNALDEARITNRNRTIYILIAVALLAAALLFGWVTKVRLRKKESELKAIAQLQKEKERIARDLHDNVGGQLSYIIYSLDGINEEDREKRMEITESINQSVRGVIGNLRETIWAISDANISLQDFSDKLKIYARSLFKHTDVAVHFKEDIQTEKELNALLGLNLYRICQEILTNAFKHSNADEIIIKLQSGKEKLMITIADNGIGFDTLQQKDICYGLQNVRKRAGEFGLTLTLETAAGKGTKYELVV